MAHNDSERQRQQRKIIIQFLLFKYLSVSVSNGNVYQRLLWMAASVSVWGQVNAILSNTYTYGKTKALLCRKLAIYSSYTQTGSYTLHKQIDYRAHKYTAAHTATTWLLCSGCMENLFNSCCLLSAAVAVVVCWFDCHCPFCRFRSLPLHDFSIWWISLHWTHIGLTSFWTIYSAEKIKYTKNVENTSIS